MDSQLYAIRVWAKMIIRGSRRSALSETLLTAPKMLDQSFASHRESRKQQIHPTPVWADLSNDNHLGAVVSTTAMALHDA